MSFERYKWLRDQFSDEIPNEILDGRIGGNFKVRRNWWQGLVQDLELGVMKGVISEELKPDVEQFIDYYTSDEFKHQLLTKKEDIQRANDLLEKILNIK